ncbi:MAG: hypothetical protein NUV56_04525, partial [Candidatus Uhrbacteria bacterium]|nr:hypothetical protein [Candidatus Uhrbacteria bacterium]
DKDSVRFGILQVCASHGTVLIGGLDSEGHTTVLMMYPESSTPQFVELQPAGGSIIDFWYAIWYSEKVGRFIVETGYGDAGWRWWDYHAVDMQTMSSDLIERCSLGPSDDDTTTFQECRREYVPE